MQNLHAHSSIFSSSNILIKTFENLHQDAAFDEKNESNQNQLGECCHLETPFDCQVAVVITQQTKIQSD